MKIVIENYTKILSNTNVLDNVNLVLESGKIYGFVGKNGSGKTMLMRAICGLIIPNEGGVYIDGQLVGADISFPKSVGAHIENPGFISNYTGYKNLKYLASIKNRITDENIFEVLKSVGLNPLDKKAFRKYSLGMKQKLSIAAAIMEKPDLLILDEPYNSLDEETVDIVREIIINYKSCDKLIILACHDKEEIDNLCDEIIYISNGKVKLQNKQERLVTSE